MRVISWRAAKARKGQGETRENTYTIDVISELLDGFVPGVGRPFDEERVLDVTSTDGSRS